MPQQQEWHINQKFTNKSYRTVRHMTQWSHSCPTKIAEFMGPTWGPPGSCRPQMGPMLAPWTLLSGYMWFMLEWLLSGEPSHRRVEWGWFWSGSGTMNYAYRDNHGCHYRAPATHIGSRQNGRHFADSIIILILLHGNCYTLIQIVLDFVPNGPITNKPSSV